DGIRDLTVTGVQTCALPIFLFVVGDFFEDRERPIDLFQQHDPRELMRKRHAAKTPDFRAGRRIESVWTSQYKIQAADILFQASRSEERRVGYDCCDGMLWDY